MKRSAVLIMLVFCLMCFYACTGDSGEEKAKIAELTARVESMQRQIDDVQAVKAIEKLQTQYLNYVIYNKLDDVWTLFTEDGVLDVFQEKPPAKGAEEITAIFQERKAMVEENMKKGERAIMFDGSPLITVEGDKAKSSFLLFNIMAMDKQGLGVQQGSYDLEFMKENGQWKISSLKYTREFSIGSGNPNLGKGPAPGAAGAPPADNVRK